MESTDSMVLHRPFEPAGRIRNELSRETGLKSGTLYPILIRLAKFSLLETKWVITEDGIPPRHTYRLTPSGLELIHTVVADAPKKARVRQIDLQARFPSSA